MGILSISAAAPAQRIPAAPLAPGIDIEPLHTGVERLLQSPDLRDRTWGAHLAGRFGFQELVPALVGLLDPNWPFGTSAQRELLVRATLDGLIQLRAEVNAEQLLLHAEAFPDETIILAGADPEANRGVLFSLVSKPTTYTRWLALSNLLAATRAPGFAALLMRELKMEVFVSVSDDGRETGFGIGSGGAASSCGVFQVPRDYPPIAVYKLTMDAEPGLKVVARGRHVIYAQRKVARPAKGVGRCEGDSWGPRDEERMHYLAGLLETSVNELPLRQRAFQAVAYRDASGLAEDMARTAADINSGYTTLISQLQTRALLAADEAAGLKPQIHFSVSDHRLNQSSSLPSLDGVIP